MNDLVPGVSKWFNDANFFMKLIMLFKKTRTATWISPTGSIDLTYKTFFDTAYVTGFYISDPSQLLYFVATGVTEDLTDDIGGNSTTH